MEAVHANAPDFLIADGVMPEMSGIDLAIMVRETFPRCTVLMFSGQVASAHMLETASDHRHYFEVLKKPVHPTEILARDFSGLGLGSGSEGSTDTLLS